MPRLSFVGGSKWRLDGFGSIAAVCALSLVRVASAEEQSHAVAENVTRSGHDQDGAYRMFAGQHLYGCTPALARSPRRQPAVRDVAEDVVVGRRRRPAHTSLHLAGVEERVREGRAVKAVLHRRTGGEMKLSFVISPWNRNTSTTNPAA
jgi:hypothetical protein